MSNTKFRYDVEKNSFAESLQGTEELVYVAWLQL